METSVQYRDAALNASVREIRAGQYAPELLISRSSAMAAYYAPFDYVNSGAKIVIVGITPGRTQAANAIEALQSEFTRSKDWDKALKSAKVYASFSGPMRANLVAMLDFIGVNTLLWLQSTARLFEDRSDLAHFTSALRYPVFVDGKDYSGAPSMVANAWLRPMVERWFGAEAAALRNALFVPLGPKVEEALGHLVSRGILSADRVVAGLPHPSGANAERISYFLGRKSRELLSAKTNPVTLDRSRERLLRQMSGLRI
jgi:hypothetical protein